MNRVLRHGRSLRYHGCVRAFATLSVAATAGGSTQGHAQATGAMATSAFTSVSEVRRFSPEFSSVSLVFELEDGRLIVADRRERELRLIGTDGADHGRLGRNGDGPGEYRSPSNGFVIGKDSMIIIDAQNSKWYLVVGSRITDVPNQLRGLQRTIGNRVDGVSRSGDALSLYGTTNGTGGTTSRRTNWVGDADSVIAVRHSRTGTSDTIARLHGDFFGKVMVPIRMNGARDYFRIGSPLATNDQAVMFNDGRVAVAYHAPYRVDWRTASGEWIRGKEVQEQAQPVTPAIRARSTSGYLRNNDGSPVLRVEQVPGWPNVVPPFQATALLAGSDGNLYVRRTQLHPDDVQRVDVFDHNGRRIRQLQLPLRSRLVGSGKSGLYVARRDADDVERVVLVRANSPGKY